MLTLFKTFCAISEDILLALSSLGTQNSISDEVMASLEAFTCQMHQPKINIRLLHVLRWRMLKQTNEQKL